MLIIFIAYLPNRPEQVDAQVYATRQAKADESRAAGVQKLTNYELIDAEAGTVRIPIDEAISLTIASYKNDEGLFAHPRNPHCLKLKAYRSMSLNCLLWIQTVQLKRHLT